MSIMIIDSKTQKRFEVKLIEYKITKNNLAQVILTYKSQLGFK